MTKARKLSMHVALGCALLLALSLSAVGFAASPGAGWTSVLSENFDSLNVGHAWDSMLGTAGGGGNLGGGVVSVDGNHVFQISGGGTGVRSTQKMFMPPITGRRILIEFDWNVGAPSNSLGGQLSIEDPNGQRFLTLQTNTEEELIYSTGGVAANEAIEGVAVGSGFDKDDATYHIHVVIDFVTETIDLMVTDVENPSVSKEITGIPFNPATSYQQAVGKLQFSLARAPTTTTAWTSWIDNLEIYVMN